MSTKIHNTTMLYKRLNFSVSKTKQLVKSLKHSLRIRSKEIKVVQWDEDLAHKNIYIINGKRVAMTQQAALEFLNAQIKPLQQVNKSKEQRQEDIESKGKYKYKIKRIIKDETGNPIATYLENLLEQKVFIDSTIVQSDFDRFEVSRKAQKLQSVQNYIDLHNNIVQSEKPLDGRKTVIQEAFFKFPMHNQVDLPPKFYITAIQEFYAQHFPDYKVIMTVYHGDELEGKGKKKVGDHPHIFIDCKNKRTGEYDLTEQQALLANKVIESVEFFKEYEPVNTKQQTYQESQIIGEALQELFYQHINQKFIMENIPILASKVEATQENLELRKKIRLESKKPKEDRAFNLYTLRQEQLEEVREEVNNITTEISYAVELRDDLLVNINKSMETVAKQEKQIERAEIYTSKRLKSLSNDINEKKKSLEQLADDEQQAKLKIKELNQKKINLKTVINSELEKHNKAIKALNEKINKDQKRHGELQRAIKVINEELQPLIHSFDVKVDKILNAKQSNAPTESTYKDLKDNIIQTARYLGKDKREDYLFNVQEKLKEVGLDNQKVEFNIVDKTKLWASDTFTSKQTIEFDAEEKREAAKARAKRMLIPKPPSPFNNPYDPYQ
tara:strand:- start:5174 stop:7015 length:1842 start_codon:yes stop_codon:yes gene_type:complete